MVAGDGRLRPKRVRRKGRDPKEGSQTRLPVRNRNHPESQVLTLYLGCGDVEAGVSRTPNRTGVCVTVRPSEAVLDLRRAGPGRADRKSGQSNPTQGLATVANYYDINLTEPIKDSTTVLLSMIPFNSRA